MHRSQIIPANTGDLLEAAAHPSAAIYQGAQQYETPAAFAELLVDLLPCASPKSVIDPQCGNGNLLKPFTSWRTDRFGIDIDRTINPQDLRHTHLQADCAWSWKVMDECWPDTKWECIVSNPPFGITWKETGEDSTQSTWDWTMNHLAEHGCGFMIANAATIERLGIHKASCVYGYLKTDASKLWKNVAIEIGAVLYWKDTWDQGVVGTHPDQIRPWLEEKARNKDRWPQAFIHGYSGDDRKNMWKTLAQIRTELVPAFNLSLLPAGTLRLHLSTHEQLKRKLTADEIKRLHQVNGRTPMALTSEVETRRLLREITAPGAGYTAQPEAVTAIQEALEAVAREATCPIMPPTDFQVTAYADEHDSLVCKESRHGFKEGRRYPVGSGSYEFQETITRIRQHVHEASGTVYSDTHECSLSGRDRYIELTNSNGQACRFMSYPSSPEKIKPEPLLTGRGTILPRSGTAAKQTHIEFHECELWEIFQKPPVLCARTARPESYAANLEALRAIEASINASLAD